MVDGVKGLGSASVGVEDGGVANVGSGDVDVPG
jgi:hypothetical protein